MAEAARYNNLRLMYFLIKNISFKFFFIKVMILLHSMIVILGLLFTDKTYQII